MDVSNEAIVGVGSFGATAISWWIARVVASFEREVEKLWSNSKEVEQALHELSVHVARIEASQSKHR